MSRTARSSGATDPAAGAGVRVELEVPDPPGCPVAAASTAADSGVGSVRWTAGTDGTVTEQFTVEDADGATDRAVDAEAVFDHDGGRVYQVTRDRAGDCVCERIERLAVPVADVRAAGGSLFLTLHVESLDRLREVVDELREGYGDVHVRSLSSTGGEALENDPVTVRRGRLTDRQREALETAVSMGYFEYPRQANASDVAEAMGIGSSTFIEHLTAAQRKVFGDLLPDALGG